MIILIIIIFYLLFVKLYLSFMMLLFILIYTYFPIILELHLTSTLILDILNVCTIETNDTKCIICYEQINKGIKLPCKCNYIYHIDCIREWFKQTMSCPLCRTDMHKFIE